MVNTCADRTQQGASSDYFRSGLVFVCGTLISRRCLPKLLQDIFRTAPADILTKELPDIMKILTKVTDDDFLQENFLEKIPSIAAEALDNSARVAALKDVIGDYLLPVVVRNLGLSDIGINLTAQSVLVQMIEKGYVTQFQAEVKICPAILALTKIENPLDVNTRAITLMSKFIRLLGKDIAERILLKRFIELCSSHLFYVRKLSTWQFGHYCAIVGKDVYEKTLLPCYLALCQDEMWTVRKSCAEVITFLSCVCPSDLRKSLLAPAFDKLLKDECKWVKISAYQTLGGFIATFSDPPLTKIAYDNSGDLVLVNQDGDQFNQPRCTDGFLNVGSLSLKEEFLSISAEDYFLKVYGLEQDELKEKGSSSNKVTDLDSAEWREDPQTNLSDDVKYSEISSELKQKEEQKHESEEELDFSTLDEVFTSAFKDFKINWGSPVRCTSPKADSSSKRNVNSKYKIETEKQNEHDDDLLSYNQHNYWYISPPELDVKDLLSCNGEEEPEDLDESSGDIVICHVEKIGTKNELDNDDFSDDRSKSVQPSSDNKGDNLDNKVSNTSNVNSSTQIELKEPPQTVVPHYLIVSFLSMAHTDPNSSDNDMSIHCAYSMPAVISTLGKDHWPLLKDTVNVLAAHLSYKIRRSVASSLYAVASILGSEKATEDLAPLFETFLVDLDEVRIGILNNLFHFLELMSQQKRDLFLPKLDEFLRMNSVCNWRFQETFAEQLTYCVQLYKPADVRILMGFYANQLLSYNVAVVRHAAAVLFCEILKCTNKDHVYPTRLLSLISAQFARAKEWRQRQTYAMLCIEVMEREALTPKYFASKTGMLPHLLELSWDSVVNVRLVVANCIVKHLIRNDYFRSNHMDALVTVLTRLEADKDRDVRMAANAVI